MKYIIITHYIINTYLSVIRYTIKLKWKGEGKKIKAKEINSQWTCEITSQQCNWIIFLIFKWRKPLNRRTRREYMTIVWRVDMLLLFGSCVITILYGLLRAFSNVYISIWNESSEISKEFQQFTYLRDLSRRADLG